MLPLVYSCLTWFQKKLAWSNSWPAWKERMIGLLFVAGVALVCWYGSRWTLPQQVLAGTFLLVATAFLLRHGWVKLFGPVLWSDLVRSARGGRLAAARSVYAVLLLTVLLCTFVVWFGERINSPVDLFTSVNFPAHSLGKFAVSFFHAFVGIQLLAVLVLTPVYTAGVIAQEKERGTLDALLATDLRSREIVLSMVVSRLAILAMFVLTGLPVFSVLMFWGGIDPGLVLAGFAMTGLTMASLAGLSILQSVYAKRPRDAILRTYMILVAFLVLTSLLHLVLISAATLGWDAALIVALTPGEDPVTIHDLLAWPCTGNPLVAVYQFDRGVKRGGNLAGLLWDILLDYTLFHSLMAVLCVAWAVWRLRAVARKHAAGKPQKSKAGPTRRRAWTGRPTPVGTHPMLWKETVVEARFSRGPLGWLWLGVRTTILFLPVIHFGYHLDRVWSTGPDDRFGIMMNVWVRAATILMGCLMLLAVATRAAGSISGERERQTLDGLLATPLENRALLFAKWLGSLLGTRWAWFRLGLVWTLGLITGGLHPLAVPGLLLVWLVYAAFLASLGLWFSVASRSTRRATFWTLLAILGAVLASGLVTYDLTGDWLTSPETYGLTVPPVTLGWLAFSPKDYREWASSLTPLLKPALGIQLLFWSLAAVSFYVLAVDCFRRQTGRTSDPTVLADPNLAEARKPAESPSALDFSGQAAGTRSGGNSLSASGTRPLVPQGPDRRMSTAPAPPSGRSSATSVAPSLASVGPRWPKRLLPAMLVLLPLSLVLGWYAYLRDAANRSLQEAIAEADRLDPGWRLEELEARRLVLPDALNSGPQAVKAHSLIPKDWVGTELERLVQNLTPEVQLTPQQTQTLRAALQKVQAALVEARRLADLQNGHYPVSWSPDGFSTQVPHVQAARELAGVLAWDVLLRAQEEDADGALTSCRAILNAGRSLADEPLLISQLARATICQMTLEKIERTLAQGQPSEGALAALQRLLEDEDRQPVLLFGLRGERAISDRFFEALQAGQARVAAVTGGKPPRRFELLTQEVSLSVLTGSVKKQRAAYLKGQTQLVEIAKLPVEQQDARFKQMPAPARTDILAHLMFPAINRVVAAFQKEQGRLRCALAAVAVERYQRQHDRWPESLATLVPTHLSQVPLDPFDGQPIRYRRLTDGVVIYCVGPDLQDDGGKLDRQNPGATGTDLGLRLWDIDQRRQMPSTPIVGPPRPDRDEK
jgi:ABC-type transport system involved in multi-copper enzyme maturation permease subunit